jgi:death-on-curing protein
VAPEFLSRDELVALHDDQLRRYGGFVGVRDEEALTSALATPEARMNGRWVHQDLAGMAAAYLYQLARYRPFVDGNRRTAALAALLFLELNGARMAAEGPELADLVRAAGAGDLDQPAVAGWLRQHVEAAPLAGPEEVR